MMRRFGYAALVLALMAMSYALCMGNVRWALLPHAKGLALLYGLEFRYAEGVGYVCDALRFVISPDCMGIKLFLAAFAMLCFGFAGGLGKVFIYFVAALGGAFFVTILRIAMSLPFAGTSHGQLIHNLLSLGIYFGTLVGLYAVMSSTRMGDL